MPTDDKFMYEAVVLARRGLGHTHPNPAVGCVIVNNGEIIGRGWHRKAGLPHAEVEALRAIKQPKKAIGATAYITMEPCSTHGRTPPCTDALARAGIKRVVIGVIDPNPRHRGRALKKLGRLGIKTKSGVLQDECQSLNPEFDHFMSTGFPWVIVKCGMSLDGRLTRPPGESRWITSTAARADAMKLRAQVDAVLVGAGTVRADNPSLTVRGIRGAKQPWRIVWAPRGMSSLSEAQIFHDTWKEHTVVLEDKTLRSALRKLAQRGISKILVEGGGHTLGCLFDERLVNEAVFYIAPVISGGKTPSIGGKGISHADLAASLVNPAWRRLGECLVVRGKVTGSNA
jgi:diaminohydroxyphosphoribosylaminopyrimidine deaminase/5-amino-6-(5-phosphoribosylamino)uracil reductase